MKNQHLRRLDIVSYMIENPLLDELGTGGDEIVGALVRERFDAVKSLIASTTVEEIGRNRALRIMTSFSHDYDLDAELQEAIRAWLAGTKIAA